MRDYSRPNNGGKRRRHCPPSLSNAQVLEIRSKRLAGVLIKVLEFDYGVDRSTIRRAINGAGVYNW